MRFTLQKPTGRPYQVCATENGKEVRVSTGTFDETEAKEKLADAAAAHRMGLDWKQAVKGKRAVRKGDQTEWEAFRHAYRERIPPMRPGSALAMEGRLNLVEEILGIPKVVGDVCNRDALKHLRERLVKRFPSKHTARSRFQSIKSALRWAVEEGYAEHVPDIKGVSVARRKKMKGRPLTPDEFRHYLETARDVCREAYPGWEFFIRGVKAQGMRLEETLMIHWTDPRCLRPNFTGRYPRLEIPAALQKNDTEEDIPMTPDFEDLLLTVPKSQRVGFVFKPDVIRRTFPGQRSPVWAGRVLCRIGKASGILTDRNKYASAHDLRRTCAQDMMDCECDEADIMRVMRHSDFATTRNWYASKRVENSARDIRAKMRKPSQNDPHADDRRSA